MIVSRPTALPIDPWGTPDRGFATMRVTSPYGTRTGGFAGFHGGLDIGNARLGDDIIAVADGTVIVSTIQPAPPWNYAAPADKVAVWGPSWGGLTTVIDHGGGWFSQYAHQRDTTVRAGQRVARSQLIGHIGDTGSAAPPPAGGGGHLHFGMRYLGALSNGQNGWVDPWPLISGADHPHQEDDVDIPSGLKPLAQAVVGPGNRLRADPATTEGSRIIGGIGADGTPGIGDPKAYWVQVYGLGVPGAPYTLGGQAGSAYAWVGVFGRTWFVAEPLLTNLTVSSTLTSQLPAVDCTDEVEEARRAGFDAGFSDAKAKGVAAVGAVQP